MLELFETPLTVLHVLVCFFLILVVLIQPGKSGGLGAALGGAGATQVFGGRGAGNFLSRATWICASTFFLTSIVLAYISSSADDSLENLSVAAAAPAEPATKAAEEAPGNAGGEADEGDPAPAEPNDVPAADEPAAADPNAADPNADPGAPNGAATVSSPGERPALVAPSAPPPVRPAATLGQGPNVPPVVRITPPVAPGGLAPPVAPILTAPRAPAVPAPAAPVTPAAARPAAPVAPAAPAKPTAGTPATPSPTPAP